MIFHLSSLRNVTATTDLIVPRDVGKWIGFSLEKVFMRIFIVFSVFKVLWRFCGGFLVYTPCVSSNCFSSY